MFSIFQAHHYLVYHAFLLLAGGIALIFFSSKFAVKHSALLASALGISPLIIGITLVSIGTDISEIMNSIIASSRGYGDIDVADSVGSSLTQITLVFGLLPMICTTFYVHRKDMIILGGCLVLALIVVYATVEKGFVTRINALFLVGSLAIYVWVIYVTNKESIKERIEQMDFLKPTKKKRYYLVMALIGFAGVTAASIAIVESIIFISEALAVPSYILSFFLLSIGTSLPELAVEVNALKAGHHSIAIGDVVGSCIVDSSLSIGIGFLLFPQPVSASIITPTIIYVLIASMIVIILVTIRKKVDKYSGVVFIGLYAFAFILFFLPVITG